MNNMGCGDPIGARLAMGTKQADTFSGPKVILDLMHSLSQLEMHLGKILTEVYDFNNRTLGESLSKAPLPNNGPALYSGLAGECFSKIRLLQQVADGLADEVKRLAVIA